MYDNAQRINFVDFIKGICMILVIWGHCIEYCDPISYQNNNYYSNPLFEIIYSFHMPLFMLLSGYFFSNNLSRSFYSILRKRFIQLIMPCLTWGIIGLFLIYINSFLSDNTLPSTKYIPYAYINIIKNFWFIWVAFFSLILSYISCKLIKNKIWAFCLSFFILLLLPDNFFFISLYKYMYPFYWLGYLLNNQKHLLIKRRKYIILITFPLFIILLFFWEIKYYIYITGMAFYKLALPNLTFYPIKLNEQIRTVLFRYIIGTTGSLSIFYILNIFNNTNYKLSFLIQKIGKRTLGIYIIQSLILEYKLITFNFNSKNIILYNSFNTFITALILIILATGLIIIIEKNKFLNFLLLGNRWPNNYETKIQI